MLTKKDCKLIKVEKMSKINVVAIDGPAGAGKSTIAKAVARKLGILYLDTGAMYRAVALHCIKQGLIANEIDAVEKTLALVNINVNYVNGVQIIFLNNQDVTNDIRTQEVGNAASAFSAIPAVRLFLVEIQRKIAEKQEFVIDGRDIGTYVFPNAKYKFYLTASIKERAKRRHKEMIEKGMGKNLSEIEADIAIRDHNDMSRKFAPLKQAEDAVLIDSTQHSIDAVVDIILSHMNAG
jgi:cytidylate kinase